ncbi:MAG: siderophore-interacting protein [Myxococcota bacterium]
MTQLKQKLLSGALTAFGTRTIVHRVWSLSPGIRCIRLFGPAVETLRWAPGDKVKIHVGSGVMRSYTPARINRDENFLDVVVHLHGGGPASQWASHLQRGDEVLFAGPAPSMPRRHDDQTPWALFLGDETALGLAVAMVQSCSPGTQVLGAIELAQRDAPAVDALDLPLHPLPRDGEHGNALAQWLENTWLPPDPGIVWLSGEANAVLRLRTALLERGVTREQLCIKPYWSLRGAAHRKQLERGALVA